MDTMEQEQLDVVGVRQERSWWSWLDVGFDLILCAFGVLFLIKSPGLKLGTTQDLGAGAFPLAMSALVVLFSLIALIGDVRAKLRPRPQESGTATAAAADHAAPISAAQSARIALLALAAIGYVLVVARLGVTGSVMILATLVQVAALHKRPTARTIVGIVVFSVVLGVLVQLLFVRTLHIDFS